MGWILTFLCRPLGILAQSFSEAPTASRGVWPLALSEWLITFWGMQHRNLGSQAPPSGMEEQAAARLSRPSTSPCPRCPQEKVNQLKEEVRLQYEKLHQLLDEDLRQTVEVLDKAQAKFCSENAAQALHLGERMQEAKKLLGSLQLLFDKTEDVSFMKVGWARPWRVLLPQPMPHQKSSLPLAVERVWGSIPQSLTGHDVLIP